MLKKSSIFLHFWINDPLCEHFQHSVLKGFIATPIDVLCSNFVKFGRLEIRKVVCYLPDKKTKFRLAVQLSLLRGSHPKSARASHRQCTQSAPDFIQIGTLPAELYPNAWTPSERARKWIQSSRIITVYRRNDVMWTGYDVIIDQLLQQGQQMMHSLSARNTPLSSLISLTQSATIICVSARCWRPGLQCCVTANIDL